MAGGNFEHGGRRCETSPLQRRRALVPTDRKTTAPEGARRRPEVCISRDELRRGESNHMAEKKEHDGSEEQAARKARGGGGAFMKPMQPDEALAAVVGTEPMPRTEVTKRIWDYIRTQQPPGPQGQADHQGRRQAQEGLQRQGCRQHVRDDQAGQQHLKKSEALRAARLHGAPHARPRPRGASSRPSDKTPPARRTLAGSANRRAEDRPWNTIGTPLQWGSSSPWSSACWRWTWGSSTARRTGSGLREAVFWSVFWTILAAGLQRLDLLAVRLPARARVPDRLPHRALAELRQHLRLHRDLQLLRGAGGVPAPGAVLGHPGRPDLARHLHRAWARRCSPRFDWLIFVFGAFLVYTGVKILVQKETEVHPEKNPVLRLFQRFVPLTTALPRQALLRPRGRPRWSPRR